MGRLRMKANVCKEYRNSHKRAARVYSAPTVHQRALHLRVYLLVLRITMQARYLITLQMRKIRLRKVRQFFQRHTQLISGGARI